MAKQLDNELPKTFYKGSSPAIFETIPPVKPVGKFGG